MPAGSPSPSLVAHRRLRRVHLLTLNRPEQRNAMVPALMDALSTRLRAAAEAPAGVVLTGAAPAFCVGADLKWLAACPDPAEGVAQLVAAHHAAIRAMRELPGPLVAAVNGATAGGGLSLALAADYRVASTEATITAAYFRLGLPPDGGTSTFLVRAIGAARTMELLARNHTLSAAQALAWGLVNEVVQPELLLERARVVAAEMAEVPAETLLATRRLLDAASAQPLEIQLQREAVAMRAAARRPAFRAALARFVRRA